MGNLSPIRPDVALPPLTVVQPLPKKRGRDVGQSYHEQELSRLPFVKKSKTGTDFWVVEGCAALDYPTQNRLGAAFAADAIEVIRNTDFTPLLGLIILDQIKKTEAQVNSLGVIVGFAHYISQVLAGHRG